MKIAVYSANIGGFDKVYPPLHSGMEGVTYVYISDQRGILKKAEKQGWDVTIDVRGHKIKDPRRLSRCYHIQSINVLGRFDYDFAIQHDSNIQLACSPVDMVNKHLGGLKGVWEISLFRHPHRTNVLQEVHACSGMNKDSYTNMWPQIKRYEKEGFPLNKTRLSACMFIIWRHCETVWEFQKKWWKEVREGSVREQLSFDYVRWKMKNIHVNYLPGDPFASSIMRYNPHGAKK